MRRFRSLVLVVATTVALATAGCSGSDEPDGTSGRSGAPGGENSGPIGFGVTSMNVEAGRPPSPETVEQAKAAAVSTLNSYLKIAVLDPLGSAAPVGDLTPVVTESVSNRLAGPDRAALLDEGLPKMEGIRADRAGVDLTVMAGQAGEILMVAADVELKLRGTADGTPLAIDRTGEFLLVPAGGAWKIDGYRIHVTRDTPGGATTTTAQG